MAFSTAQKKALYTKEVAQNEGDDFEGFSIVVDSLSEKGMSFELVRRVLALDLLCGYAGDLEKARSEYESLQTDFPEFSDVFKSIYDEQRQREMDLVPAK